MAFVRIPDWDEEEGNASSKASFSRSAFDQTQPEQQMRNRPASASNMCGFLWMHNYMLTKRWRSAATGDVEAAGKLKLEFEEFCCNKNGALTEFLDSCQKTAQEASLDENEAPGTEGVETGGDGEEREESKESGEPAEQEESEETN